jgi:iron(III) transport system substrate-binding protein
VKPSGKARLMVCLIAVGLRLAAPAQARANVESLLAEINRKPPEQRLKALAEGAKKEGVVHYHGATNVNDMQDLLTGFRRQYPFIDVRYTRLGGPSVVNKVITEYRGGIFNVDAISMRGTLIPELASKNLLAKYKSPETPFLLQGFADAEGYAAGYYATGYTLLYNNTRVKPAEAPKSYDDLLNPRWKGRLVMDREEYDWLAGMIVLMGESKAISFLKRLVEEQSLNFQRGHSLITQLVAAGEYDLLVDGYAQQALQFKTKAAPIDFVFMNPTVVKPPTVIAIGLKAPHPHAAALLVDYHLAKETQEMMAQRLFYWTSRRDVKWTPEPGTDLRVLSSFEWGPKYNNLRELFRKTIGQ